MDAKIYGILSYEDEERSFVYQDWILTILPKKIKMDSNQRKRFFEKINNPKDVIGTIEIVGMTHDHKNLVFKVPDLCSQTENLVHYSVICVTIFENQNNDYSIQGIRIQGDIIDNFYPPEDAFKHKNLVDQNGNYEFSLVTENLLSPFVDLSIKSKKLDIRINFSTTTKNNHNSAIPLQSSSNMVVRFSVPITVEETIDIISDLLKFFSFINYSLEIGCKNVAVLGFEKEKYFVKGEILIKEVTNDFKLDRFRNCILYSDFYSHIDDLQRIFNLFLNEHLNNHFIADNFVKQKSISSSRIIQITAAYEKYFEDVFDIEVVSEKYLDAKNKLLNFIDERINELSNSRSKPFKTLRDMVQRHVPLYEKLNYLKNIDTEFKILMEHVFGMSIYEDNLLVDRISKIRNAIAHGNMLIDI